MMMFISIFREETASDEEVVSNFIEASQDCSRNSHGRQTKMQRQKAGLVFGFVTVGLFLGRLWNATDVRFG